jgi:hypothetical protein
MKIKMKIGKWKLKNLLMIIINQKNKKTYNLLKMKYLTHWNNLTSLKKKKLLKKKKKLMRIKKT